MKAKFLVRDDDGQALRLFYTLHDAEAFALPGFTIERIPIPPKPRPPKIDLIAEYGEALF